MINKTLLKASAAAYGVNLNDTALDRFDQYAELLVSWNEKINLTAITEPDEIVMKHFVDSLVVLSKVDLPKGASLLDIGTGAGFPGLALKIARPDLNVTLLDSTEKKLKVVKDIAEKLGFTTDEQCPADEFGIPYYDMDKEAVHIIHARAEEAGQQKEFRERFDYVTSRAVANLQVLSELCIPFVKVKGHFIAMKGPEGHAEQTAALGAIRTLGGRPQELMEYDLVSAFDEEADESARRSIVLIKKKKKTPQAFPRRGDRIKKVPLV